MMNAQYTNTFTSTNIHFRFSLVGHEFCGEVYKLGSKVKGSDLKVGDNVCVFSYVGCGQCGFCSSGKNIHCSSSLGTDYGIGSSGG